MISHVVIHPDYKNGQYHHDIALVVLKTPLNYTGELLFLFAHDFVGSLERKLRQRKSNFISKINDRIVTLEIKFKNKKEKKVIK